MRVGMRILRALACCRFVVVGAAVLLLTQTAAAAGVALSYQAPAGCGSAEQLEAGVSRIVGKPISELHSAWASANVSISLSEGGFQLSVRVMSDNGSPRERNLAVSTCAEALEAAQLIVATNLSAPPPEPEATSEADQASDTAKGPRLTIEDRPTKPGTQATQPPVAPLHGSASALHPLLAARVGLDPWLAPTPVVLGWAMLGLELKRVRFELSAGASSQASSAVPGGGAAGLVGCYSVGPGAGGTFRLWLCAGAEGGRFRASGESGMNLLNARSNDSFWSAALGQGELLVRLTPGLSLAVGVQGVAALRTVNVTQSNPQTGELVRLYSTPWVSARPWLGLDFRF